MLLGRLACRGESGEFRKGRMNAFPPLVMHTAWGGDGRDERSPARELVRSQPEDLFLTRPTLFSGRLCAV